MVSLRRPRTKARTNKRRRWLDVEPSPSPSGSRTLIAPSTRLTTLRQETGGDPVAVLNRLLNTLKENEVPGPQFFRLHKEFTEPLGEGGQGNVRGLSETSAEIYKKAGKRVANRWPVHLIAIKQYQRKTLAVHSHTLNVTHVQNVDASEHGLDARFRATEAEVLALSPNLFRGHPNIVQLMGWGLCLDTIENPQSPCCGSLQTPLLVLERASMNLRQFLHQFVPENTPNIQSRAEEGRSILGLRNSRHSSLVMETPFVAPNRRSVANLLMDIDIKHYNTIKRLCWDIGNGLQSLHEHRFTHGDLKPENVLIFERDGRWIAKLCDFGCARGELSESTTPTEDGPTTTEFREQYLGTETWLPPKEEIASVHDFEGLRKCDLFVYGLVVWSAVCLRGEAPASLKLEDARKDLKRFIDEGGLLSNKRQQLANSVLDVLEKTLIKHDLRNEAAPWKHLSLMDQSSTIFDEADGLNGSVFRLFSVRSFEALVGTIHSISGTLGLSHVDQHTRIGNTAIDRHTTDSPPSVPLQSPIALSPSSKAKYNGKGWWRPEPVTANSTALTNSLPSEVANFNDLFSKSDTSVAPEADSSIVHQTQDHDGLDPASSTVLSSDNNSLSLALFEGSRRREDARGHPKRMIEGLVDISRETSDASRIDLYYDARFRSRIRHEWWATDAPQQNILNFALNVSPPLDICTLAWLCSGPVGKTEVGTLSPDVRTWGSIVCKEPFNRIHQIVLNESDKLDRFLLLLQFGARIELLFNNVIERTGHQTILAAYVESCRPATISIVIREIYRRFEQVRSANHISEKTRLYMLGKNYKSLRSQTFCKSSPARTALDTDEIRGVFAEDWYQDDEDHRHKPIHLRPRDEEHTPLLKLPRGWKKTAPKSHVFEEEFTQTFTLTKPKVSLITKRQVEVGWLDKGEDHICHVDLTSCIPPTTETIDTEMLGNRFPFYDEDWFAMEWTTEVNQEDVLGSLRAPWLRTFAARVNLSEMPGLWSFLKALTKSLVYSMIMVGFIVLNCVWWDYSHGRLKEWTIT